MTITRTLALLLVMGPVVAEAQDVPCLDTTDFPCGFALPEVSLQRAPALLQFQSRIAQSKLPQGEAVLSTVVVKLLRGTEVLCLETVKDVQVRGGLLNLTIGQGMSCELGEVLAENESLLFQVCLGGASSCLEPIALSTVPYAIKATYASLAQQTVRANIAGQAIYAHRGTADRELYLRKTLGAGYFDFYTHAAKDAVGLYTAAEYAAYAGGGFLQWSPVRDTGARRLHLAGKDEATGQLALLTDLDLMATRTLALGDLTVTPQPGAVGLEVASAGLHVTGDSDVTGALLVSGRTTAQGTLLVTDAGTIFGTLVVSGAGFVPSGGVHVSGDLSQDGDLLVLGGASIGASLHVAGNGGIEGLLVASNVQLKDDLLVSGKATLGSLDTGAMGVDGKLTAATLTVPGAATVGGDLAVTGTMDVVGTTVLGGKVTFESGFTEPLGPPDERYVLAQSEPRPVALGGAVAFASAVTLGGPLDLAGHALQGMRLQAAAAPPAPCGPLTEGFFYLDTTTKLVTYCIGGVYKPLGAVCGNAYVSPLEGCDDGNTANGDGCSGLCTVETPGWSCSPTSKQPTTCASVCGDGWKRALEACDDKNLTAGDGCNGTCKVESGWTCVGEPSACFTTCGDGIIAGTEVCDDGDADSGDGCSATCTVETDWTCVGQPSVCIYGICGDGKLLASKEQCDDGNLNANDGCNALCQQESGWSCTKVNQQKSVCSAVCGDGMLYGTEGCDDGNVNGNDGCSGSCTVEYGWSCNNVAAQKSTCAQVCGNGVKTQSEECDDGNKSSGDGCSATCTQESGWVCNGGSPTQCAKCGNNKLELQETCEDGNASGGDGCGADCKIETNWVCWGSIPMSCYQHGQILKSAGTTYTQTFSVPAKIQWLKIYACGGNSGAMMPWSGYAGINPSVGACVEGTIWFDQPTTSWIKSLEYDVGVKGMDDYHQGNPKPGGWPNGGAAIGASGGGSSMVRIPGSIYILVAGGGGGPGQRTLSANGPTWPEPTGGFGGTPNAGAGSVPDNPWGAGAGGAGTQSGGGVGGYSNWFGYGAGSAGQFMTGGSAWNTVDWGGGGGGGGGYYGGGGGGMIYNNSATPSWVVYGGGGGGSSFMDSAYLVSQSYNWNSAGSADGRIVFTW